jgi:hypothetical protein
MWVSNKSVYRSKIAYIDIEEKVIFCGDEEINTI